MWRVAQTCGAKWKLLAWNQGPQIAGFVLKNEVPLKYMLKSDMLFQWFAYDFSSKTCATCHRDPGSCGSAVHDANHRPSAAENTAFINRGTGREISVVTFRDPKKNWGLHRFTSVFPNQSPSSFQFPICKLYVNYVNLLSCWCVFFRFSHVTMIWTSQICTFEIDSEPWKNWAALRSWWQMNADEIFQQFSISIVTSFQNIGDPVIPNHHKAICWMVMVTYGDDLWLISSTLGCRWYPSTPSLARFDRSSSNSFPWGAPFAGCFKMFQQVDVTCCCLEWSVTSCHLAAPILEVGHHKSYLRLCVPKS